MSTHAWTFVIVGANLTGARAAQELRDQSRQSSPRRSLTQIATTASGADSRNTASTTCSPCSSLALDDIRGAASELRLAF